MKRKNTLISTLIALTAASQSVQAQAPARQAFPWSSASVVETATPVVSQMAARAVASTNHYSNANAVATGIANSVPSNGYSIFTDEQGNQITREQLQANLSPGHNQIGLPVPYDNQIVHSFEQNFGQHITPQQSEDRSIWGKTKNMTSKMTSIWKKPAVFKTPEGLPLPSTKTTWAKPKFEEPTTWFSRKTTEPITFADIDSLPRKGQIPTSTDGPLASRNQSASRYAAPIAQPSFSPEKLENGRDAVSKSIFAGSKYDVAESVGNSFDPRR